MWWLKHTGSRFISYPPLREAKRRNSMFGQNECVSLFLAPVDRKVTGNVPVSNGDEGQQNVRAQQEDKEEMKDGGLQGSTSPELEAAVVPHIPEASVDCPICQGSFPVAEIELHAAYCDGEVDHRTADTDCFQGDRLYTRVLLRQIHTHP